MASAIDRLGAAGAAVQPLFITVDPEKDTPDQLKSYVALFDPRLIGLTGDLHAIKKVALAYKVYYAKVANNDKPDDYTMDHTSIMYVMDPKGEFVTHFTPQTSADDMAAKLAKLLG